MSSNSTYRVIGVMSGTSLDGIDLCEIEFKHSNNHWHFDIFETDTIGYSNQWVERLKHAHNLSLTEIETLDQSYSHLLADIIEKFKTKCQPVDLICSHGHTILHQPDKGVTKQIGNLKLLQEKLKTTVVCDFRVDDVKLGGQGAPLVPIGDQLLFNAYDYCINIGGFANVSFDQIGKRIAYDICPANKVLNFYAEKLGCAYDKGGALAKSGNCHSELLSSLSALNYYKSPPPKSLGVEWIDKEILPLLEAFPISIEDKLNTFSHHIADQISAVFTQTNGKVLFTGGGTYNSFLIQLIEDAASNINVVVPSPKLIEYKEALIFGLLGVLKIRNDINVLSSVTGAKRDHSSGVVFY